VTRDPTKLEGEDRARAEVIEAMYRDDLAYVERVYGPTIEHAQRAHGIATAEVVARYNRRMAALFDSIEQGAGKGEATT